MDKFLFKRGNQAKLPQLQTGEPFLSKDEERLYIGGNNGNIPLPNKQDMDEVTTQLAETETEINQITTQLADLWMEKVDKDYVSSAISNKVDITYKRTIRVSKLPINANSEYSWNGSSYNQDNVTTFNNKQYTVYVGIDKKPIIAKRTLPNGDWEAFDLSTITGNPLNSPIADDNHNILSVAVDSDGYIHVVGNMHANPMRYIRSANPEDIFSWELPSMTGVNENSVTYPQFVKLRDGKLLLFYRNGMPGLGNIYINEYNTTTKTWSKKQTMLIDGTPSDENPYLNHIAVDKNNVIHIMYVWRGTGNASTNNDICYAKSEDGGNTWVKSDGTNLTLPITHANSEIVVKTTLTGSGLLNQNGLETDKSGNPHGAFLLYDSEGNTQIYHVWHDGSLWHNDKVTNFNFKYNTNVNILDYTISRPSVFTTRNNKVYIMYRCNVNGKRGSLRVIDVTPGNFYYDEFDLCKIDLHDYEPTFDTQALYEKNELHLLISPMKGNGEYSKEWLHVDNWDSQFIAVISYDLNQMDAIQRQEIKLPEIRKLETFSGIVSGNIQLSERLMSDLDIAGLIINKMYAGTNYVLFSKIKVRANLLEGTGATDLQVAIKEQVDSDPAIQLRYGSIHAYDSKNRQYESAWHPLLNLPDDNGGFISASAKLDAGNARLTLLELELGILDF